jgi:hypothetical protein
MVDGEGRGDRADLPVLAEIETANLGVLLGRDHAGSPGTRDGLASAVEGARRFPAADHASQRARLGTVGDGSVAVSAGSVAGVAVGREV